MKKIFLLILLVMVLSVQSCNEEKASARKSLKETAMMENKLYAGKQFDSGIFCDKVKFSKDQLHYYYIVSESFIEYLIDDKEDVERGLSELLLSTNFELSELLRKVSGKVVYHYKSLSGKEEIIEFGF